MKPGSALPSGLPTPVIAPPGARERRELLMVLGMHRSGTSALAGLLARLGVELGHALMPASGDNSSGYFENEHAVAAHEALFAALEREWHDPRPLPADWQAGEPARIARERLLDMAAALFTGAPIVSVKDPRACRLVPLWLDVAGRVHARPSALISLRHPDEVAASLARRDGMSPARSHLLWMIYLLESERSTRGIARVFVEYDALLDDWRAQLGRFDAGLGLGLSARIPEAAPSIDTFLDRSLRHHSAGRSAPESIFRELALDLYALARRCAEGEATDAASQFDRLAQQLETQAAAYLAAVEDAVALELPLQMRKERQREGLDRSRVDAALQLAALRELWRPTVIAREPGVCKLYYRAAGDEFVEAHTVSERPSPSEGRELAVKFELPAGVAVDHLRIDPDDAPGVFSIYELSISGRPVDDFTARIETVHELPLPVTSRRAALRLASLGDDPHFALDVRGLVPVRAEGAVVVAMRFQTETVASELGDQLRELRGDMEEVFAPLASGHQALTRQLAELQESSRARSEDLLQAALTHAQTLDERIERLQQAQLSAMLEHARSLLGQMQSMRSEIDAHLDARARELEQRLAGTERAQAALLQWARRRSLGYWWNRLLGRST